MAGCIIVVLVMSFLWDRALLVKRYGGVQGFWNGLQKLMIPVTLRLQYEAQHYFPLLLTSRHHISVQPEYPNSMFIPLTVVSLM
ncbi:hypothetical protein B0I37DRAFT_125264 [Chaetomium sp. MPI-CAGE-AT-0009]|nr:hypothetical protein B0I37DRAFT_125264 [Chaetomium sp. MPI-CAGE-AT-0009]